MEALCADDVQKLRQEFDTEGPSGSRRIIALSPSLVHFLNAPIIRELVEPVLGSSFFVVRALIFDKSPQANWLVPWHQDVTIAVQHRKAVPGFGPWSEKAGIPHVQPPVSILERMLTVRIHLDNCGAENGPLRVLPGSHRSGRLSSEQIQRWLETAEAVSCCLPEGGVLLMRPLLLHASSMAHVPNRRRVLHLEFAADPLPSGLLWHSPAGA